MGEKEQKDVVDRMISITEEAVEKIDTPQSGDTVKNDTVIMLEDIEDFENTILEISNIQKITFYPKVPKDFPCLAIFAIVEKNGVVGAQGIYVYKEHAIALFK